MNSVLVTGCAGFIGSHLTDALLKHGYKVIGVDNYDPFYSQALKKENLSNAFANKNFSFYEADITDRNALENIKEDIAIVIHLAAKAGVLPSKKYPEAYI